MTAVRPILLGCLLAVVYDTPAGLGHGEAAWIQHGPYRGPDGSHCCGEQDCFRLPNDAVSSGPDGYIVPWRGREHLVLYEHVQLSENEDFWLCERRDQTPRCFFAPPAGT